jgi:hypothetical protein
VVRVYSYKYQNIPIPQHNTCHQYCTFTSNRSLQHDADVLIFHYRDMNWHDIPRVRYVQQKYVFFNIEPPHFSGLMSNAIPTMYTHFYNWTMTYRRDSDIHTPYFHFETHNTTMGEMEWRHVMFACVSVCIHAVLLDCWHCYC